MEIWRDPLAGVFEILLLIRVRHYFFFKGERVGFKVDVAVRAAWELDTDAH